MAWKADELVLSRSPNVARFKSNFLKQAVCEFRFPTLLELGDARPPTTWVRALRRDYPEIELANEVMFTGAGAPITQNAHIMRSVGAGWTVSLKQSSVSVETTAYTNFADFKARVLTVLKAASPIIDSEFFTRVGMRYINVVPYGGDVTSERIRTSLISPLKEKAFRQISEYSGKIHLQSDDGGCLLQHGSSLKQEGELIRPDYMLDIDTYRAYVPVKQVEQAIDVMHEQAFNMFDWCLNERARMELSEEKK